ncbi:MAG: T9SS type A sorting domain-containing protein [Chitinophagales bacterium]|nr:T9SS type A sorting domain-containing protein [Chitinophagales bacterium]
MRLLFTSIIIFAFFSGVRAQKTLQLDIQNTGDENFNTKGFGVNGGRMFYQIVEKSTGVIPQEIIDDFVDLPQMVYRFPGGATANFYHYKKGKLHGYGFDRTEVTLVDDPIFCNFESPSQYCIEDDSLSQQNFVFNMLELAEAVFNKNGVKLQMLYVPNMLTFMVNDTAEISKLEGITTLSQLEQLHNIGQISTPFYDRIIENIDVYKLFNNSPFIDFQGIEYGNELYFHEYVTGSNYIQTNAIPRPIFEANKDKYVKAFAPGLTRFRTMIKFLDAVYKDLNSNIKFSVPIASINKVGNMSNVSLIWNEGIRDSIMPYMDGVIYHHYCKIDVPNVNLPKIEEPANAAKLNKVRQEVFLFAEDTRRILSQMNDFFGLKNANKQIWITEYNIDNNRAEDYIGYWMNTWNHANIVFQLFLNYKDPILVDYDLVKYAMIHQAINDYPLVDYGCYGANLDGEEVLTVKRTTYNSLLILEELTKKKLMHVEDNFTNNPNLTVQVFKEEKINNPNNKEHYYVAYANTTDSTIEINPSTINLLNNTGVIEKSDIISVYSWADHIYSYNIKNQYNEIKDTIPQVFYKRDTLNNKPTILLPKWSFGFIQLPVKMATALNFNTTKITKLFPNPANNTLRIEIDQNLQELSNFKISNLIGQDITGLVNFEVIDKQLIVNVSELKSGIYFCDFEIDGNKYTGKFMVAN